ncbi:MAG: cohesin domain-containing protein [Candidatus Poribacteria bacterium]|nr:cohesin domain-containing protein [Candidatus Poribacteria bacterium]
MKQFFRRNLLFFFLVLGTCLSFTKMGYGQALVYVGFEQTEPLAVGEQVNVNIQIMDAQDVSGYELTVGFDPTALRYVESMNADYLPVDVFIIPPIVTNEAVHLVATSKAGAASESEGTLATLTFEVVEVKDSTIKLVDVILSDSAGMPLAIVTKNGRITTIELPPIGDVNEDGRVNILDLTLVASNLAAEAPTNPRVDVNEDGIVNILDLVLVAQHLDAIRSSSVSDVRVIPVSPEEIPIDFPGTINFYAEKQAIQEIYTEFYNAFNDFDIKAVQETFDSANIVFGIIFAGNEPVPLAVGWNDVKTNILGLWVGIGTKGVKWGQNDRLSDFWIRYKGSKLEASAIGYNCYKGSFPGETHLYLLKDPEDGWKIHELDSVTENNLGIFGFHKGNPRLKDKGNFFTTEKDKAP